MPTAAGLHYFYHEGGSVTKPPLVLIHGAGGDHLTWPPEARRLPDYRVYTLDLPGHGRTEGPGRQSVADYAQSVKDFMDAVGLSRAVLIGYEMGGAIALSIARGYPKYVTGMILISTGPRLPVPSAILEDAATLSTLPLAIKALQELTLGSQTPARIRETSFNRLLNIRQTLLLGDLLACNQFDMSGDMEAVEAPTLVICGAEDKLTPPRFSETLATQIHGAALQIVDGTGHMLIQEQPRRLVQLFSIFLTTLPSQ